MDLDVTDWLADFLLSGIAAGTTILVDDGDARWPAVVEGVFVNGQGRCVLRVSPDED